MRVGSASADDGGAALIRAYFRHLRWRRKSRAERLVIAWRVVTWPARAAAAAVRQAAKYGPEVRRVHGIPISVQFLRLVGFSLRHSGWPENWYRYRLYLPERAGRASRYITDEILLIHTDMNAGPDHPIIKNKQTFAAACRERGLPCLPPVAVFRDGCVVEPEGFTVDALPREDLFVKPVDGRAGRGAECWRWRDTGGDHGVYEGVGAEALSAAGLLERLSRASRADALLVQRRVTNHPVLARLSPGALCTIRVVTVRPAGEEPRILLAVLRMPRGRDKCVDNFDAGGLASPVDQGTGRLGRAVSKNHTVPTVDVHPDTGERITGTVLPCWDDVVGLCLRAHDRFPTLATVGWDVAVCPDGPVLVEANGRWGIQLPQMAHDMPLCDTEFGTIVASHIGRKALKAAASGDRFYAKLVPPDVRPAAPAPTPASAPSPL